MTKKQYELIPNWCIYENIDGVEKWLKLDEVCNLLNELYEENQSLKFQLDECQNHKLYSRRELEKENEQLKQFKEDVFNKIDMHLRMLPTARDNEFNEDDGDPSLYTGAIYMLETLKKELGE